MVSSKRVIANCLAVLLVCSVAHGAALQGASAAAVHAKDFAGTWHWMFQDRPFVTMVLVARGNTVTGTISSGTIEMNNTGRIVDAQAKKGGSKIVKSWFVGNVLHVLAEKQGEAADKVEWAITLRSRDKAEVKASGEGAPPNMEAIPAEKVQ